MRSIISMSLTFRFLVVILAVTVMVFGITQLGEMPVDVLPEFSPPYVEIQTEALGLSAKEVEQMITVPMEQDLLAGVAWLDVIRSESVPGLSSVLVYFEPGTDLYRARQMVTERLSQAAVGLPHVSKPPTMIQPLSSASRFMIVGLSSKELSLIQMSVIARWTIAPRLMGVPGVAHVAVWGNRDRQLQVQVDPAQLYAQGVSLDQVIETTGNALWVSSLSFLEASTPGTGGFIDTPNQRLGIWHVLPISSPEELAKVPIEGNEALLLGDVASVVEDHQPLIGDAVINDTPNLLLVIEKLPGINTLEVTHGVETALASLKPGLPGMEFDATLFRPASFIEMAIANLTRTLVIVAILVILVLAAFLYGWRTALISLAAIVFSLIAALFVLYQRGETLNTLVLAGLILALGVIIDDAIADVDHIVRRLRQNNQQGKPESVESIILEASTEIRGALFFATIIALLAVLPIFFIEGISGSLFQPLIVSYVLAVLAALVVALIVTPALSLILLSDGSPGRISPLIPWLQRGYERILARTIQKPWQAYTMVGVLIIAGLVALPFINRQQLLPTFNEPYLMIQLESAPATSQPEMNRIIARMSSELRTIPGIENVGAHVGRAVFGDQVVGINSAQLWVKITPEANYTATVAMVQEAVEGYTGIAATVHTYLEETLNKAASTKDSSLMTVRVFGEDHIAMQEQAEKLQQKLAGINGVAESQISLPVEEPTLEIEVDLSAAQQYGVKPGDVRRTAASLLSGIQVGSLFEEQKVFDVVVWSKPELRDSLTDIQNLRIDTPGGEQVRLEDVADVRIVASPMVINRVAASPYLDIELTIQGRSTRAVARDLEVAIQNFAFPLEYHAEVIDDFNAQRGEQQRILVSGIISLIGMVLFLQASSGNWRLALANLLTLFAALAGGVLAAVLGGESLTPAALFGLLAIMAIVARNSIALINHYQSLELKEGEDLSPALVLRGAGERVAPTVMTTLATALAFLPFVLSGNIPGHEIMHPIALVILGGLVTSTLISLFVLPTLYLVFGASREPDLGLVPAPATD